MPYDTAAGPPQSVLYQRRLEELYAEVREVFTNQVLVGAALLAILGYAIATGDASSAGASAGSWVAGLTIGDVATYGAYFIGLFTLLFVVVALHEMCHVAAFRWYADVTAYWTYNWTTIAGRTMYLIPPGGLAYPEHTGSYYRMSYLEDVVVSLAPLALTAVTLAIAAAYHLFVDPFANPLGVAVGLLIATGPSPPDYQSLLFTPRDRWETLVGFEDALDRHRAAEGIP